MYRFIPGRGHRMGQPGIVIAGKARHERSPRKIATKDLGVPPTTTSTTKLRCYDPTGTVVTTPQLTFTQVTSDAAGPC